MTQYHEDQDALNSEAKKRGLTLTITNYTGNASQPLAYSSGPASRYSE